jgi:hypothetical protein
MRPVIPCVLLTSTVLAARSSRRRPCLIDQIRPLDADKLRALLAHRGTAAHRG